MPHLMHSLLCKSGPLSLPLDLLDPEGVAAVSSLAPWNCIGIGSLSRGEFREALGLPRSLHCQCPEFGSEKPAHIVRSSDRLSRRGDRRADSLPQRATLRHLVDLARAAVSMLSRLLLGLCAAAHSLCERRRRGRAACPVSSSYLVDPASRHMLASKIKPCMSKYKSLLLRNCVQLLISVRMSWRVSHSMGSRSNSRANTCRLCVD